MAQGRSTKSIWIRTSRLSIKSSLSGRYGVRCRLFNVGALRRQKMKKQIHAWNLSHLNDERANPSLESEPCLVWQRKNCFRPWQIRTRSIFFRFPVSWLAHSDLRGGSRYGVRCRLFNVGAFRRQKMKEQASQEQTHDPGAEKVSILHPEP